MYREVSIKRPVKEGNQIKKHFISFLKKDGWYFYCNGREREKILRFSFRTCSRWGKNVNEIEFDGVTLKGTAIS